MRRVVRWTARGGLVLLAVVACYAAFASWRYRRIPHVERGCDGCTTRVAVNGYDLFYRELGSGDSLPPVILVHGGPGHSSLSFKEGFDFLARDRRVVMYDQRGSGRSQERNRPGDYTVDALVAELEALRRDVVKADRVVLVGHSFGSAIVQRYALAYPAHVDRLVLVAGVRINNGTPSRLLWTLLGPMFWSTALGLPPMGGSEAADEWFNRSEDVARLHDRTQASLLANTGIARFATWRDVSMSVVGPAHEAELRALQVPVAFLYGASDAPYTGKPVGEYLCGLLPRCRMDAFARSGHWPYLEEPQAFQRTMGDVLRW